MRKIEATEPVKVALPVMVIILGMAITKVIQAWMLVPEIIYCFQHGTAATYGL